MGTKNPFVYVSSLQTGLFESNSDSVHIDIPQLHLTALAYSESDEIGNEEYYMESLTRIVKSFTRMEATFAGRAACKQFVSQMLINAACMERMWNFYPQISQQRIVEPIFIVGVDRLAMGFLQRLLACDPCHRAPKFYEMLTPYGRDGSFRPHSVQTSLFTNVSLI